MAGTRTKLPDNKDEVPPAALDHESGLYRHRKRPEWGVAILAWEKEGRRAYQFEDGRLRKFKEGYYSLMEPAENVERPEEIVVSGLERAIDQNKGKERPKPLEPVASFDAQVELFTSMYPEGFQDPEWISEHRGEEKGRALKRHRDPAIAKTQELLSAGRCEELIAEGSHDELVDAVTDILGGTSLVALKHVKELKSLEDDERKEFAEAVAKLLHGEGTFDQRFKEYVAVLKPIYGRRPSWRLATALPALMYPNDEVCVRYSAFVRQAASIAPVAKYTKRAQLGAYRNFRRVAFAVRKRLQAAGHEPRDLLDIHDFIWATLRNAALDHLG